MRCWVIPTNFGCTDTKTDDERRELFDGAVPVSLRGVPDLEKA